MSKLTGFLTLFIALFSVVSANAQSDADDQLAKFEIEITSTPKGLTLTGNRGTAWTELGMTLRPYKPQAIDFYGMSANKRAEEDQTEESSFLVVIQKTDDGVKLEGVKGTAWEKLSFSLPANGSTTINQLGMK